MILRALLQKEWFMIILLVFATMVWGSTFILVKQSMEEIDVFYYLFLRFGVAFIAFSLLFPHKLVKPGKKTIKHAFFLGTLLFTIFVLQTEGVRFTSASNNALITGLYMVFTPFAAMLILKTKPRLPVLAGAILSFSGLYFLTQYSYTGLNVGDLLTLGCAVVAAFHIVYTSRYAPQHSSRALMMYQSLVITLFSGLIVAAQGTATTQMSHIPVLTILIGGLGCTVFSFTVMILAQRIIDPGRASLIYGLEAVFGTFFAWLWGGERLTALSLFGATLMISGIMVSELSPLLRRLLARLGRYPKT